MRWWIPVAMTVASALLGGCGGGGGGGNNSPAPVRPAQWGEIDRSFGSEGRLGGGIAYIAGPERIAVGADGSLFIAVSNTLEKRDANGALVAAFGNGGIVELAPFNVLHDGAAPVVDEDGNVYVISGAGIAKFDSAGHAVAAFGTNGHAALGTWGSGGTDYFTSLARDSTGNLYVGGLAMDFSNGANALITAGVAKFDSSGQRVASFASGGIRLLALSGVRPNVPPDLEVDAAGHVFVAGGQVVKLDANGGFAADFGTGGVWETPDCGGGPGASDVELDSSGNLLVAANCTAPSGTLSARVFKLEARGDIVPSFREAGRRAGLFVTSAVDAQLASELLVAPDGSIYVGGQRRGTCEEMAVAKLDPAGNVIPAFDGAGAVFLPSGASAPLTDLAMDNLGRLYAAGVRTPICPQVQAGPGGAIIFRLQR